jgi:hypothetical protein
MLGGGVQVLPGRNFARYHLTIYILFCMVIRTAYQGIQYNIMLKVKLFECSGTKNDFFLKKTN